MRRSAARPAGVSAKRVARRSSESSVLATNPSFSTPPTMRVAVGALTLASPGARGDSSFHVDAVFDTAKGIIPGQLVKIAGPPEVSDAEFERASEEIRAITSEAGQPVLV